MSKKRSPEETEEEMNIRVLKDLIFGVGDFVFISNEGEATGPHEILEIVIDSECDCHDPSILFRVKDFKYNTVAVENCFASFEGAEVDACEDRLASSKYYKPSKPLITTTVRASKTYYPTDSKRELKGFRLFQHKQKLQRQREEEEKEEDDDN